MIAPGQRATGTQILSTRTGPAEVESSFPTNFKLPAANSVRESWPTWDSSTVKAAELSIPPDFDPAKFPPLPGASSPGETSSRRLDGIISGQQPAKPDACQSAALDGGIADDYKLQSGLLCKVGKFTYMYSSDLQGNPVTWGEVVAQDGRVALLKM